MILRLAGNGGFHLGAVELIELGAPHRRPPMLENRPQMGAFLATAGKFLADALTTIFGVLADIVEIPTDILVQGVDVVFENFALVMTELPWIGDLAAQVLLAAGAILKFGISVPLMTLTAVGNLFEGISKALDATVSPEVKKDKVEEAKKRIVDQAPEPIKPEVKKILDDAPTGGTAEDPVVETSTLTDVLKIGVPAAIAVGAVAILAS